MSFEGLLDQKCSIYHLAKGKKELGYGIKEDEFSYPEKPDIKEVPCHLKVDDSDTLDQTEDANEYIVVRKLNLPYGTDVRVNDKIVILEDGLTYYAEVPRNIRDHHVIVNVQRKGKIKGAI